MSNKEKVIKGLECCTNDGEAWSRCMDCPYGTNDHGTCDTMYRLLEDALKVLKKEPVNCSDCKHYGYNNMTNQDGFCYCIKHHEYPSPDFFCADGERG